MQRIEWDQSYSVGISDIDEDHKKLISIINRVVEAVENNEAVLWTFDELKDYTQTHFSREEDKMKAADYPDFDNHKIGHEEFIKWLKHVKYTYELTPETSVALGESVSKYLQEWLVNHILKSDMEYKGKI
jgi:hemerythrin-like metal-binding protein